MLLATSLQNLNFVNEEGYQSYLKAGYAPSESKPITYRGYQGTYYKLSRLVNCHEHVTNCFRCIACNSLAVIASFLTCGSCLHDTCDPCTESIENHWARGTLEVFVCSKNETKRLKDDDFKMLGYQTGCTSENMKQLVKKGTFPLHHCESHNTFWYMPFYGPKSNFSYVIIIETNEPLKSLAWAAVKSVKIVNVWDSKNNVCSQEEMICKAEAMCERLDTFHWLEEQRQSLANVLDIQNLPPCESVEEASANFEEMFEKVRLLAIQNPGRHTKARSGDSLKSFSDL